MFHILSRHKRMLHKERQRASCVRENFTHSSVYEVRAIKPRVKTFIYVPFKPRLQESLDFLNINCPVLKNYESL